MSSKKKPRPLFEVPTDIESGGESGWVYRSTGHADHSDDVHHEDISGMSITDNGTAALALGFAAFAQTMALGLALAAIPFTIGLRMVRSFRSE